MGDARRFAELARHGADTVQGVCEDLDWPNFLAVVNIGGARQAMGWVGVPPWPGDRVRVIYTAEKPWCVAVWGASQGTVTAVVGGFVTVTGDDSRVYRYPAAYLATAGDRVFMDHGARLVTGKYPDEPAEAPFVPGPPPPTGGRSTATFNPTDSGNYRGGVYQDSFVEVSDYRTGVYWYGTQIRDTVPATAVVTRAELRLTELWDELPGTASKLGTHTQQVRGATAPTLTGGVDVYDGGVVNILGFADALKTGAAYGVGFVAGFGWRRFGSASTSGAITMEWE